MPDARFVYPAAMTNQNVLDIRGLRFTYPGAREPVLEIDELILAEGEQLLLTGGSGSGKSTLLHLIAGLIDPQAGSITVAGRSIHKLRGPDRDRFRGKHIGLVFQTHQLLPGFTALENVELAMTFTDSPPAEHADRAHDTLRRLGIDRPRARPDDLSVGQQQRVAVARALVTGPELLLADEPTASLDPDSATSTIELIQEVCRERDAALLLVSHDPLLRDRFEQTRALADLSPRAGEKQPAAEAPAPAQPVQQESR